MALADIPAAIGILTATGSWSISWKVPPSPSGRQELSRRSWACSYRQVQMRCGTSKVRTPGSGVSPMDGRKCMTPPSVFAHSNERLNSWLWVAQPTASALKKKKKSRSLAAAETCQGSAIDTGPGEPKPDKTRRALGQGTSTQDHFRLVLIAVDRLSTPETLFRPQLECPYSQAPAKSCVDELAIGFWCSRVSLSSACRPAPTALPLVRFIVKP